MKLFPVTLMSLLLVSSSYAQKLDLFQDIEVEVDNEERVAKNRQNKIVDSGPAFVIKGISRFGDKYLVSILPNNNTPLIVRWSGKTSSSLKGFPGYSIVDVKSRSATLVYPESQGCTEFPAQGIKCNGPYMLLSLANGEPIEQSEALKDKKEINTLIQQEENLEVVEGESGRFFRNPFSGEMQLIPELSPDEQAIRDERRQRRSELFRDFEIVRIPDEEIPEGMQRVRTPFGDSLEPIESE
jgi:transcription antitermination factor NusG